MTKQRHEDAFARIAEQPAVPREGLIEPQPPALPDIRLPAGRSNPRAAFRPAAKMETPAHLERALVRERRRTARFLSDLAPEPASIRTTLPIPAADWRLETEADRRDFAIPLRGGGRWERVSLPHYGGPVGRFTTLYRTSFRLTRKMLATGALFACFKGVDYKAHVFINGSYLGSHEGFFAPFEFEFTNCAHIGDNVLLVKVENDANPLADSGSWVMMADGDKLYAATGLGWDEPELGWHHCPPGMGIYQPVTIEARPRIHLADVFVRPLPDEERAELWVEVWNAGTEAAPVSLSISVFGKNFRATVFRDLAFAPPQQAGPGLNSFRLSVRIPTPRLWDLDTPWLYEAQVALSNGDVIRRPFGMRTFRMDAETEPRGRFSLNGRELRLRGANTMGFEQQDVFKGDFDQLRDDILLAKLCNMNFWRLTQRPVQPEVYDMCDRLGLLTQTDLPLFGFLPRRQFCEAVREAGEMERLIRGHACNILVSYINEPFAVKADGKGHRQCTRPELERFFEAASHAVRIANPDRVIKPVDGDYDPPGPGLPDNHCYNCWYNGHGLDFGKLHKGFWQRVKPGWRYGCGEFGTEGLDPVSVMRKYYPKSWLPQSSEEEAQWSPNRITRAQTGRFHYMFFDTPRTLDGWVDASLRHQAWATRMMTEAFRRDTRMNSFAIHLFIDAFPSGWMKAIMDVERRPKPAYFTYRDALTPLMASIRSDRWSFFSGEPMRFEFWICNDTHARPAGARLRYQLEIGGRVVFAQQAKARIEPCAAAFQGFLDLPAPRVSARTDAVLRLALAGPDGRILHDTALEIGVFPAPAAAPASRTAILGARDGKAARLARALGVMPSFAAPSARSQSQVILIDDVARFERNRAAVESAVQRGATAVFLEVPRGKHAIAGSEVAVEPCGMNPFHFVSRATEHPLTAGFRPDDFRLWHDPAADRIAPLLNSCFFAEGWTPILTTGSGRWQADWTTALAAAEKPQGKGRWLVCQVSLSGRTATNPAADLFARRLLIGI